MTEVKAKRVKKPKSKRGSAKPSKKVVVVDPKVRFDELMGEIEGAEILNYSMFTEFKTKTALEHPTFGVGVVVGVMQEKIDVAFPEGSRLLVHNRKK